MLVEEWASCPLGIGDNEPHLSSSILAVCAYVYPCVCVYVCVCERVREKESMCVYMCMHVYVCARVAGEAEKHGGAVVMVVEEALKTDAPRSLCSCLLSLVQ